MKIQYLSPLPLLVLSLAVSCSSQQDPTGTGGTAAAPGSGGSLDTQTGGAGNSTGTGGVGNTGNSGNSGGVGNTGNSSNSGGVGNTGNSGNSGGVGNTGNSGNSGGVGNTGNSTSTGGTGDSGGTGGTGSGATGGTVVVPDPPPLQNPMDGRATHYWDCCKPSCAWPDQGSAKSCTVDNQIQSNPDEQSGCFGGNSYQCWSMSPWAVSDTLAYGFAAFNEGACGSCYQLEFTGTSSSTGSNDPGSAAIADKIMIVQTLNRGGISQGQFDLLVPGGGVGDFDACSTQWNASGNLGERYGGYFLECRNQNAGNHEAARDCARNKCNELFGVAGEEDLLSGCLFWTEWANMADNPNFKYGQVECPEAITAVSGM